MTSARSSAVLLAAVAAGCTVGPDHRAPMRELPESWSHGSPGGASSEAPLLSSWWTSFGDATLNALIERAVAANPDLRMAHARVLEARALRGWSKADGWPSGGLGASYTRQRISENEPVIGSLAPAGAPLENDVFQVGFDASWELDLFGGKRRALEAADAELEASEANRQDVLQSLLAEVSRDYVELRALQRRLEITRENLHLQQDVLDIARVRFEGGLTDELDVTRAAGLLASTRSQVPAFEERAARTMHRLAILLGSPPASLTAELSQTKALPTLPERVPAGLPSDLLRRRPDVRRAERQLAAATARIGVETAELFPRFPLTGDGGLRSTDSGEFLDADSRYFALGPLVQWRLFDFARIRARIEAQDAREAGALAAYEKVVLASMRDVEDALIACALERLRHASIEEEVEQAQRSVETVNVLYSEGRAGFLEVLDAQRSLHSAQDRLVQSQQALLENVIALCKGLGGGWESFEPLREGQDESLPVPAASPESRP